jgi:hypothetical protein
MAVTAGASQEASAAQNPAYRLASHFSWSSARRMKTVHRVDLAVALAGEIGADMRISRVMGAALALTGALALGALVGCTQLLAGAVADQEEDCLRRVPSGLDMVQCTSRVNETNRQYEAKRERLSTGQSEKAPTRPTEPLGCFKRVGSGETVCPN